MIKALNPATAPRTAKTVKNWKLVQVSGRNEVCICGYDDNDSRTSTSTIVEEVFRSVKRGGVLCKTESGSYYFLKWEDKNPSIWQVGLQAARPDVYQRLVELDVF